MLRETGDTRHNSFASEAMSEMTYPPVSRLEARSVRNGPPPSSFVPVQHETSGDDSDTLYSNQDHYMPTVIRSASRARLQGANVVGVAPARLQSVTTSREISQYDLSPGPARVLSDDGKLAAGEYDVPVSSMPFSPALPSTAGSQLHFLRDSPSHSNPDTRQSIHSAKSFVPSFISKVSSTQKSFSRLFARRKVKPLPPVPVIPHIPISAERNYRREEESMPLPVLAERASTLNGLLEKGYHPHQSLSSYYHTLHLPKDEAVTSAVEDFDSRDEDHWRRRPFASPPSPNITYTTTPESPMLKEVTSQPKLIFASQRSSGKKKKHTVIIVVCVFIVIALAAVGAGVGVTLSRKSQPINCSGDFTGAACNMNSTCVCTSSIQGRCDGLAQNIVDILPTMNTLFNTNYSPSAAYISLWFAQGSVTESTCASQSLLIDVAPGLISGKYPNRTAWAQSALLWNLIQSQDTDTVRSLQSFVLSAPWPNLANSDGPVEDPLSTFSVSASGFTFNFASQTIAQPSVSFVSNGQPSDEQNSRVGSIAHNALDRMYSFALASSTQRQGALLTYWTSVLLQKPSDLTAFVSAFVSSPILVPFDATSQQVAKLYDPSSPFPPPIACYPSLGPNQLQRVDEIESMVFGLAPPPLASKFDVSCYPDRPTYGVLDLLRLRLPFDDSRTGVAKQAVVLNRDVGIRAIVHSGEILSALPANDSGIPTFQNTDANPRQFGTLNHINHVVLSFLQAMDVNVATAVANYVLADVTTQVPPTNSMIPSQYLSSIPTIEVAVFGFILPADISTTVSSFTTDSGALFFGSSVGEQFRLWSLSELHRTIQWTENATAPLIGDDSSLSDRIFNQTWLATAHALESHSPVSVNNITNALQSNGKLTPT